MCEFTLHLCDSIVLAVQYCVKYTVVNGSIVIVFELNYVRYMSYSDNV